tara:strand:+ start:959 stop:1147 length:189 start_codon:yes stop_codon:yes gene_type:complete
MDTSSEGLANAGGAFETAKRLSRITASHRCIQNIFSLTAKDSAGEPLSVHSKQEEADCDGLR